MNCVCFSLQETHSLALSLARSLYTIYVPPPPPLPPHSLTQSASCQICTAQPQGTSDLPFTLLNLLPSKLYNSTVLQCVIQTGHGTQPPLASLLFLHPTSLPAHPHPLSPTTNLFPSSPLLCSLSGRVT